MAYVAMQAGLQNAIKLLQSGHQMRLVRVHAGTVQKQCLQRWWA